MVGLAVLHELREVRVGAPARRLGGARCTKQLLTEINLQHALFELSEKAGITQAQTSASSEPTVRHAGDP